MEKPEKFEGKVSEGKHRGPRTGGFQAKRRSLSCGSSSEIFPWPLVSGLSVRTMSTIVLE